VKRLVDLLIGTVALIVTAPLAAIVAVAVRLADGRPVLFRQQRSGRGGRPFELVKFRTMRVADGPWDPAGDADRTTRLGRWLRSTSLDELPTLLHVVVGTMSLVGPRPLPVEYLPRYSDRHARRLEVRPGITGLAQVEGRNQLSWEERFELDVWYVEHRTLGLDLRILGATVWLVLRREGTDHGIGLTMTEFRGPES